MTEFYPQIKLLHLGCVLLSGCVFATRGALMLADSPLSRHPLARGFSYLNDTVLLAAGLLLIQVTQLSPFNQPWLALKLGLLPLYIVLGIFALRLGRSRARRAGFFGAALLVYLAMFSIARAHHPWGALRGLAGGG